MNGAFVHLAVNHVPVVTLPVATALLLWALIKPSRDLAQAAFAIWIISAAVGYVALKSGGPAAHTIWGLPGIVGPVIHAHAKAADKAFWWGALPIGVLSLLGCFLMRGSRSIPKGLAVILVLWGLAVSVGFARVAHLGGLIRHPEIAEGFVAATPPPMSGVPMQPPRAH